MKRSDSLDQLAPALRRVMRKLKPASRNQAADDYTYADLSSVIDSSRALLHSAGLMAIQTAGHAPGLATVTTLLLHVASGQFIEDTAGCAYGREANDYGATITKLRRYGLACIVGLVQEDQEAARFANGQNAAQRLVEERRAQ